MGQTYHLNEHAEQRGHEGSYGRLSLAIPPKDARGRVVDTLKRAMSTGLRGEMSALSVQSLRGRWPDLGWEAFG